MVGVRVAFVLLVGLSASACAARRPIEIVAHRGHSSEAYELTMGAYKLAHERGATSMECDVLRTSDDQLVVLHDRSLLRTTGIDRDIATVTLAEATSLEADRDAKWEGRTPRRPETFDAVHDDQIPSLQQLLDWVAITGTHMKIEVKDDDKDAGHAVIDQVLAMGDTLRRGQITLFAWHPEQLRSAVTYERSQTKRRVMRYTWLISRNQIDGFWTPMFRTEIFKQASDNRWSLGIQNVDELDPSFFAEARAARVPVGVWTVNDVDRLVELARWGADALITDRPDAAATALQDVRRTR